MVNDEFIDSPFVTHTHQGRRDASEFAEDDLVECATYSRKLGNRSKI